MKYRSKLYASMVGISLASMIAGLGFGFWDFKRLLLRTERTKAITVAATTAAMLDPELVKTVEAHPDEKSEPFLELKRQLQRVRDANRRDYLYVGYLYTLRPNPANPKEVVYLVDAEENPKKMSYPGEVEVNAYVSDLIHHMSKTYSEGQFISDQYGVWMTGYAPVRDKHGNYVATVGVDLAIQTYQHDLRVFMEIFGYALLGAIVLSVVGAHFLSKNIGMALVSLHKTVLNIGQGDLDTKADLHTHDEFEDLANEINNMTEGLRERERLKLNFARYVSQHILEQILSSEAISNLEGERRKITVLFSDIRQFTLLAERLAPEEVVSLLNEYFTVMIEIIFKFHGTLDKFIGDGIMVEFGAPLDDALQEKNAIETALAMQEKMKELNASWEKRGKPVLRIGIGIHTGQAVVGNIGSEIRMEYTAVGDTVNIAARLEQMTKVVDEPILISEMTYLAVKEHFQFKNLGSKVLPGREVPIVVYALEEPFYK
jgi:adenylate cyclase